LDSVQSTKVGTIPGSINTVVLDLNDGLLTHVGSIGETVVGQKMEHLKQPRQKGHSGAKSGSRHSTTASLQRDKADAAKSLAARRQILVNELRAAIATHGRYDVKTANISAALGDLLNEPKQYSQSIKLHRDAVEIYSSNLGDDHSTTMEAKLRLGKVLDNADK
jgi:hypothetical protein